MSGRLLGPPPNTLPAAHFLHHDLQEVSNIPAFFKHFRFDVASLQGRNCEPLARQPEIQQVSPFTHGPEVGKLEPEKTKSVRLQWKDGEVAGRENHVVKKSSA